MVTDIDTLNARMEDPTETFTQEEVQALIDWHVARATADEYNTTKLAAIMQAATATTAYANAAMDNLLALWDASPMVPDLQVITNE